MTSSGSRSRFISDGMRPAYPPTHIPHNGGAVGVPQSRARALLDHKQPGIEAHYLHSSALRDELLADQERMSAFILQNADAL